MTTETKTRVARKRRTTKRRVRKEVEAPVTEAAPEPEPVQETALTAALTRLKVEGIPVKGEIVTWKKYDEGYVNIVTSESAKYTVYEDPLQATRAIGIE